MFDWLINLFLGLGLVVEILLIVATSLLIIILVKFKRIIQRGHELMDDVDRAGRWLGRLSWSRSASRFLKLLVRQTDDDPDDQPPAGR